MFETPVCSVVCVVAYSGFDRGIAQEPHVGMRREVDLRAAERMLRPEDAVRPRDRCVADGVHLRRVHASLELPRNAHLASTREQDAPVR